MGWISSSFARPFDVVAEDFPADVILVVVGHESTDDLDIRPWPPGRSNL